MSARACCAPWASLYLDPRGNVQACCMNTWQRLGRYGPESLTEIWRGGRADALRAALDRGDLTLGCDLCDVGAPDLAFARSFDRLDPGPAVPEWPRQLELALSNTCNLRCTMCNGELSSAIRRQRDGLPDLPQVYGDEFFAELATFLPHLTHLTLLGGEPLLGREPLRVLEMLVAGGHRPQTHVTTNGTRWDRRIAGYVDALPIHVAVSIDAVDPTTFAAIRLGADHERVMANVAAIREATAVPGKGMSIAMCLMAQNWQELRPLLAWADGLDVDVFVNAVDSPSTHSLRHRSPAELDAVAAGWDAQEATGPRLVRNAGTWDQQRRRLDALRAQRAGWADDAAVDRTARALVAERAGTPPTEVRIRGGRVVAVEVPDGGSDLLDPVVGGPLHDVLAAFEAALGRRGRSELVQHDDGVEERTFTFHGPGGTTTVHAAHPPAEPDGGRWYFAVGGGSR